jgi:hypothetical protein
MSIVTNISSFNSSSEILEKDYENITSLSVKEKNTIDKYFTDLIPKLINLKKADLSNLGMYQYMKQFLLFDIEDCKELYLYLSNPKNIFLEDFNDKRDEFMLRIKNLDINLEEDIIEQLEEKNKELQNIKQFYKNLTKLEIEFLKTDYLVLHFFAFQTLIEFELLNCNYYILFGDIDNFLSNNKNLKKFILNKYEYDIIHEELYFSKLRNLPKDYIYEYHYFEDDDNINNDEKVSFNIDKLKDELKDKFYNMNLNSCGNEVINKFNIFNCSEKIFVNDYFDESIHIYDLDYLIKSKIEKLSYVAMYDDYTDSLMQYENKNNKMIILNLMCGIQYKINYLPCDLEYLYTNLYKLTLEDNLPVTLKEIKVLEDSNIDNIKIPFGCKVIKNNIFI